MDRYELLAAARSEAHRMAAEYRRSAYNTVDNDAGTTRDAAYVEAACDRAEMAVFDLLNALSTYGPSEGIQERARAVVHVTDLAVVA